jgi:hypothetical protein
MMEKTSGPRETSLRQRSAAELKRNSAGLRVWLQPSFASLYMNYCSCGIYNFTFSFLNTAIGVMGCPHDNAATIAGPPE